MANRFQKELELFKAKNELKFTFGVLACTILTTCLLIVSSFSVIHISHYFLPPEAIFHPILFANAQHTIADYIIKIDYVPQVPAIAFMSIVIGRRYSIIAILLYILIGLFLFPVFSMGGGIKYVFQYGFGYVLGFIPMVFILSHMLKDTLKPQKAILASLLSVTSLHLVGMFYLILICAIRHEPFGYVQDLLYMMTFVKFIYDVLITFVCIYLANMTRKILWLAMD